MAHAVTFVNTNIPTVNVYLDDKLYNLSLSPYDITTVLTSKTFGIDLTGVNTALSSSIGAIVYDVDNDRFERYTINLGSEIYDSEDELIFDFENGVIYYGESVIRSNEFTEYHKNITGIELFLS